MKTIIRDIAYTLEFMLFWRRVRRLEQRVARLETDLDIYIDQIYGRTVNLDDRVATLEQ